KPEAFRLDHQPRYRRSRGAKRREDRPQAARDGWRHQEAWHLQDPGSPDGRNFRGAEPLCGGRRRIISRAPRKKSLLRRKPKEAFSFGRTQIILRGCKCLEI